MTDHNAEMPVRVTYRQQCDVIVKTGVVGFHRWPQAPEGRRYLRDRHRHRFNITAQVPVQHNDRHVEFHDLIDEVHQRLAYSGWRAAVLAGGLQYEFGDSSCEMIASYLAHELALAHGKATVAVDEDGECGAVVTCRSRDYRDPPMHETRWAE